MSDAIKSAVATVDEIRWRKFHVLNDGFVTLVDVMGDDSSITQAARVSYGAGTKKTSDDRQLIRFLMRHRHTTPFEMAELKFLVRVPMDCWRQWIRHRTANVNEYSTRYSEAIDSQQKTDPAEWRLQSGSNKQGSGGMIPAAAFDRDENDFCGNELSQYEGAFHKHARQVYDLRLEAGVAREQARKDLPLSTYTEAYWKIDLHNLFHFLSLRMDSHAQLEIRLYATIIGREIVAKLFPLAWEAFEDYRLGGMFLTRLDSFVIGELMRMYSKSQHPFDIGQFESCQHESWKGLTKCRERDECLAKLQRLGLVENERTD